jgi:carbon-monoxide dehydrogenase large subunit
MEKFAVGQSVPRTEDPRLLTGRGRYLDDARPQQMAHAYILRSPHAHARITAIDPRKATQAPEVLAVFTGADWKASGLGDLTSDVPIKQPDGKPKYETRRPGLVLDRVRTVGDPVALVIAETLAAAKDAAELIEVEYDPLPVIADTAGAIDPGAALVWDDCPNNLAYIYEAGNKAGVEAGFAKAHRVVRQRFVINRVTANTMEPRGCIAEPDKHDGRLTLQVGVQNPHNVRQHLANEIFHLPETSFRILPGDLGGSFGMKGGPYIEHYLTLWAARELGRPVKWLADRTESFLSDNQGRDNVSDAELALDADGKFLAVRVKTLANLGAYMAHRGPIPTIACIGVLAGVYTTPALHVQVKGLFTHTQSTAPYRGAGRPEAACIMERLVEKAAREMGIDAVELRRRNLIPPDAMPYKTGLTLTYDCGDFAKTMDRALTLADYNGFEQRRAEAKARGKLRGIGVSNTIEQAGGRVPETAEIRFDTSGFVTLITGTTNHGQGHETIFKQILVERLGIAPESIRLVEGDTDRAAHGLGTFGSRSAAYAGSAIVQAADKIVDKGRKIASHLLEAAEADIEFAEGAFQVAGTDRKVSLVEVAKSAFKPEKMPPGLPLGFNELAMFASSNAINCPNGCHVCEVEIDPETGAAEMVNYVVVDDVGTVINPLLLKGQIQGGVAQGVGQALLEDIAHDPETGQILTATFMDYAMPRASDLCSVNVESCPTLTKTNPLGAKGAGEAGCVGALPCLLNALENALAPVGVTHIEMPATPHRLWRAIREATR